MRVYLDGSVPAPVVGELERLGAQLVRADDPAMGGGIGGMFWRFLVAADEQVDRVIACRLAYTHRTHPPHTLHTLHTLHLLHRPCTQPTHPTTPTHRAHPAPPPCASHALPCPLHAPSQVDRFIVRDSDSRLNARERLAVEEWIASGTLTLALTLALTLTLTSL